MSEPKKCPFCGGSGEFTWHSYFLCTPEIEIPQICANANTILCLQCCQPECDLAKGRFLAVKSK